MSVFLDPNVSASQARMNMQRNNDELFGLDPISFEQMTHPVIDQGGHTFDMSTIDDLVNNMHDNRPLLCPIGREVIHVDRLVPNLLAKEAIERMKEMSSELTNVRHLQHLPEEMATVKKLVTQVLDANQKISNENKEINCKLSCAMKKLDNIAAMSTADKFLIAFGPLVFYNTHLSKVLNRGVEPQLQPAPMLPSAEELLEAQKQTRIKAMQERHSLRPRGN